MTPRQPQAPKAQRRGVRVVEARRLLLKLPNVTEGRSYGMPSFLLNGRFLARFRDDDTVLVLQLATISERDVLMELDPHAFFFTEHYRNYPAVLVRLAEVARPLLIDGGAAATFGWAWLLATAALGLHVADEAAHDFLAWYNPRALRIRQLLHGLPFPPTFTFLPWLSGLGAGVLVLAALTPLAYGGVPWLRP